MKLPLSPIVAWLTNQRYEGPFSILLLLPDLNQLHEKLHILKWDGDKWLIWPWFNHISYGFLLKIFVMIGSLVGTTFVSLHFCSANWKNNSDQTYSCPRDWSNSASWMPNWESFWNHIENHSTIVLRGLSGPWIGPPLCWKMPGHSVIMSDDDQANSRAVYIPDCKTCIGYPRDWRFSA